MWQQRPNSRAKGGGNLQFTRAAKYGWQASEAVPEHSERILIQLHKICVRTEADSELGGVNLIFVSNPNCYVGLELGDQKMIEP